MHFGLGEEAQMMVSFLKPIIKEEAECFSGPLLLSPSVGTCQGRQSTG